MRFDKRLLRVPVIGLAFGPGLEAAETFQTALSLDPNAQCWAIVSDGDARAVRNEWPDGPDATLVIVHAEKDSALGVACELVESLPSGPVALLLADLPIQRARFASRKHTGDVIRRLEESHPDLQVHLHNAAWLRRPPRIR